MFRPAHDSVTLVLVVSAKATGSGSCPSARRRDALHATLSRLPGAVATPRGVLGRSDTHQRKHPLIVLLCSADGHEATCCGLHVCGASTAGYQPRSADPSGTGAAAVCPVCLSGVQHDVGRGRHAATWQMRSLVVLTLAPDLC